MDNDQKDETGFIIAASVAWNKGDGMEKSGKSYDEKMMPPAIRTRRRANRLKIVHERIAPYKPRAILMAGMRIPIRRGELFMTGDIPSRRAATQLFHFAEHHVPEQMDAGRQLNLALLMSQRFPKRTPIQPASMRRKEQRFVWGGERSLIQIAVDVLGGQRRDFDITPLASLAPTIEKAVAYLLKVGDVQSTDLRSAHSTAGNDECNDRHITPVVTPFPVCSDR